MKNISNNYPEWNEPGTEPDQTKKDNGWQPGEKPPADWFNWKDNKGYQSFQDIDAGIARRLSDVLTEGVLTGGVVTENTTADLNILVEPLTGFNANGARINLESQQTVDLSSYLPTTAGNEKYVSIYVGVIDLETNTQINIVEGTPAAAGSATKPAIDSSQGVLLADVLLAEGQITIVNVDIEEVRKQKINLKNIAGQMDYINVKDYGAVGDGLNYTQEFKNAINFIKNSTNKKTLFIPNGIYILNYIELPDNINIIGESRENTILKAELLDYGSSKIMINEDTVNGNSNIIIKNITVDGNAGGYTAGANTVPNANNSLVAFKYCDNILIDNYKVINYACDFDTDVTDENKDIMNTYFYSCDKVEIKNVVEENCKVEGLALRNSTNVKINNFRAENNPNIWTPLSCITFESAELSKNIEIEDIYLDGSGGSLFNLNGVNIKVSELTLKNAGHGFLDMGTEGMSVDEKSSDIFISDVIIENGASFPQTSQGIGIACVADNVSINNIFVNDTDIGISCRGKNININNVNATNLRKVRDGGIAPVGLFLNDVISANINNINIDNSEDNGLRIDGISENINFDNITLQNITNASVMLNGVVNIKFNNLNCLNGGNIRNYTATPNNNLTFTNCYYAGTSTYFISLPDASNIQLSNIKATNEVLFNGYANDSSLNLNDGSSEKSYRNPIRFGDNYMWIDSTGTVRVKIGTHPTADTDGVVVGSQT